MCVAGSVGDLHPLHTVDGLDAHVGDDGLSDVEGLVSFGGGVDLEGDPEHPGVVGDVADVWEPGCLEVFELLPGLIRGGVYGGCWWGV